MTMKKKRSIKEYWEPLSTKRLLEIWVKNDRGEYTEEAFNIIAEILTERGEDLPPQEKPKTEPHIKDSGFWEFNVMVSRHIIQWLYSIGFVILTISGVAVVMGGSIAIGIGVLIGGNLIWRVLCEGWILFFRIHDTLASINRKLSERL